MMAKTGLSICKLTASGSAASDQAEPMDLGTLGVFICHT